MGSVGAHELLLENSHHERNLWNAGDGEIEQFLRLIVDAGERDKVARLIKR